MLYFYIDNETKMIESGLFNSKEFAQEANKDLADNPKYTLISSEWGYYHKHTEYVRNPNYFTDRYAVRDLWKWVG